MLPRYMKWNTTALKEFHPTSIYLFVAYFLKHSQ